MSTGPCSISAAPSDKNDKCVSPSVCPGSDVNSMDSVDSGCTMGAGDSQSNHTASSSLELIIWEIEVPKVSQHKQDTWGKTNQGIGVQTASFSSVSCMQQ